MEKEVLAGRIEATDAPTAAIVRDEQAVIDQLSATFLRGGAIYRVEKFAPTRPIMLYIGCSGEKDNCTVLNADEKAFYELAGRAGLLLDDRARQIAYAEAFLKIVFSPVDRLQILNSIKDLKERPNMEEADKKRYAEILKQYQKIVVAPSATGGTASVCTFFAVKNQDLVRLDLTVMPDGKIKTKESVLESNLPIPYAL